MAGAGLGKAIVTGIGPLAIKDAVESIPSDIQCALNLETNDRPQHIPAWGVAVCFGHLFVFNPKLFLKVH